MRISVSTKLSIVASLGILIVFAVAPTAASGQAMYSVTDLGTLPGFYGSDASAINTNGQVVGWAFMAGGTTNHAFVYKNGEMTDLNPLVVGDYSEALGINNNGEVVGYSPRVGAFLYSFGTMITNFGGAANGINDSDEVVGGNYSEQGPSSAFLYKYSGGVMTGLGLPSSASVANGINNNGQIVGANSQGRAFLYSSGTMTDLGALPGGGSSEAFSINESGQVVGVSSIDAVLSHAFLYEGGTMSDLGTLGGSYSFANCINDSGQVVGYAYTASNVVLHAFVYSGGAMIDLNSLITNGSGWILESATGINDCGQIVGFGTNFLGQTHAFLLTPVSKPSLPALTISNIHNFDYTSDAYAGDPQGGLVLSGGTLYGTAMEGGSAGHGTVFKVTTNGTGFTTLYGFTNGPAGDGAAPNGDLFLSGGYLFGTTRSGGFESNGTAFKIYADTNFANLWHFTNGIDGAYPSGGLISVGGELVGSTRSGGAANQGTIFEFQTSNSTLSTLHSFEYFTDGAYPDGKLVLAGNALFGVASSGGSAGNGAIFAMNEDGSSFSNLYSFSTSINGTNADGFSPQGGLVLAGATLYGTASGGGFGGNGTVFRINIDGTGFTNLHNFADGGTNNSDGISPQGPLLLSSNVLYGTASGGGSSADGTVFMMKTDGTGFTNLYSFSATINGTNGDGAVPQGGLVMAGYTLYGAASKGGSGGGGTLFALGLPTPPPAPLALNWQIVHAPPTGEVLLLTWTNSTFSLQSAPAVTGPFTNIPGATSPYAVSTASPQMFFRLKASR